MGALVSFLAIFMALLYVSLGVNYFFSEKMMFPGSIIIKFEDCISDPVHVRHLVFFRRAFLIFLLVFFIGIFFSDSVQEYFSVEGYGGRQGKLYKWILVFIIVAVFSVKRNISLAIFWGDSIRRKLFAFWVSMIFLMVLIKVLGE